LRIRVPNKAALAEAGACRTTSATSDARTTGRLTVSILDESALAAAATSLGPASRLEITIADEATLTLAPTVDRPAICLLILILDEAALTGVSQNRPAQEQQRNASCSFHKAITHPKVPVERQQ